MCVGSPEWELGKSFLGECYLKCNNISGRWIPNAWRHGGVYRSVCSGIGCLARTKIMGLGEVGVSSLDGSLACSWAVWGLFWNILTVNILFQEGHDMVTLSCPRWLLGWSCGKLKTGTWHLLELQLGSQCIRVYVAMTECLASTAWKEERF